MVLVEMKAFCLSLLVSKTAFLALCGEAVGFGTHQTLDIMANYNRYIIVHASVSNQPAGTCSTKGFGGNDCCVCK